VGMETVTTEIRRLLDNQRNFFHSGQTKDIAYRKKALQKSILKKSLRIETPLRYPPFKNKLKYLKKLMH
jgi:hypothetical protein